MLVPANVPARMVLSLLKRALQVCACCAWSSCMQTWIILHLTAQTCCILNSIPSVIFLHPLTNNLVRNLEGDVSKVMFRRWWRCPCPWQPWLILRFWSHYKLWIQQPPLSNHTSLCKPQKHRITLTPHGECTEGRAAQQSVAVWVPLLLTVTAT